MLASSFFLLFSFFLFLFFSFLIPGPCLVLICYCCCRRKNAEEEKEEEEEEGEGFTLLHMVWGKRGNPGPCELWGGWEDGWYGTGTGPVASLAAYLLAGLRSLCYQGVQRSRAGFFLFFSFFFLFLLGVLSDTTYLCRHRTAQC